MTSSRDTQVRNALMHLVRLFEYGPRKFTAQVIPINKGATSLKEFHDGFIGNLNADVVLESFYFDCLLQGDSRDSSLRLGGELVHEKIRGEFERRGFRMPNVSYAVQLFSRECYESIAGGDALPNGGPDIYAEVNALITRRVTCNSMGAVARPRNSDQAGVDA